MFNVCPSCGMYAVEKEIHPLDSSNAEAICPFCQYAHPFLRLPLFLVSGASGTGKTRLCLELARLDRSFIHLDTDILWGVVAATPEDDYQSYRNTWMNIAKNINQSGRPVVLYGSAVSSQFENCPERRYFSSLNCLALVCGDEILVERLRARPGWRGAGDDGFVQSMLSFNRWFWENGAGSIPAAGSTTPLFTTLDTSTLPVQDSAGQILEWLREKWSTSFGDL